MPRKHGARGRTPPKSGRPERAPDPGALLIWGTHSIEAALFNPRRRLRRLLATEAGFARVAVAATQRGVRVERASEEELDRRLPRDAVHQGLLLECEGLPQLSLGEAVLDQPGGARLVIVLDQITDPHNLGAILRSAAAFSAMAVIVQERHSPPLGGTVAKAASGALDRVPVIEVVNIARALDELKQSGFQVLGFDSDAAYDIAGLDLRADTALVMGAEGDGLRRLVRETCDRLVRLPTAPRLPSLNVSNATAVALYEVARQRRRHP
jgi:23S rRNA (guanosine2251-2'-O)-methyltransferase